jgi:hypothetical protein
MLYELIAIVSTMCHGLVEWKTYVLIASQVRPGSLAEVKEYVLLKLVYRDATPITFPLL